MTDKNCRLLLFLLLFIGQLALLLHQQDIEHHAYGQQCAVCLAAQGLDHALAGCFVPPVFGSVTETPPPLTAGFPVSRTLVRLVARSPPLPSLHA